MTITNDERISSPTRDDINRLVQPMEQRTKRFARTLKAWFLAFALGLVVFIGFLTGTQTSDPMDTSTRVGIICLAFVFFGLLPVVAVDWLVLRDIREVGHVIRDGTIFAAQILARDLRSLVGGASHIIVGWREEERDLTAHFDVPKLAEDIRPGVAVVSGHKSRLVAVVLNDKLYLAKR